MEIIICSDNHGLIKPLEAIKRHYPHAQAFIHCGDSELEPRYLQGFESVSGNNDYFYDYPDSQVITVEDVRILIIHGHQFSYAKRVDHIAKKAINNHCTIACWGHTHVFDVQEVLGVTCINPGSMRTNRDGTPPSFAHLRIDNGKITVTKILVSEL